MKLFFETSRQATCFLCMVPVGFVAALCLELSSFNAAIRPLMDVFVLLAAGFAVLAAIVFCCENTLRLYHVLGLMVGALLCTQGIGKIISWFSHRQDLKRRLTK